MTNEQIKAIRHAECQKYATMNMLAYQAQLNGLQILVDAHKEYAAEEAILGAIASCKNWINHYDCMLTGREEYED